MLGGAGTAKGSRVQDEEGARGREREREESVHVEKEIKEGDEANPWDVFVLLV